MNNNNNSLNSLNNNLDFLDLLTIIGFIVQMQNISNDENRIKINNEKEKLFYQELEEIKKEDHAIVEELREIKELLKRGGFNNYRT